jgi:hypothetical protein
MKTDPVHMIGQSIVDLVIHSGDYRDVQDEAADLFKSKLAHSVNSLFDEVNAGSLNSYFFQRLQLDLGRIDRSNFAKEFEKRLLEQLRHSLGKIKKTTKGAKLTGEQKEITIRSEQDTRFELLTHFLAKGFLPWQSPVRTDQSLEQLFAECIAGEPLRIRQFLFRQGASEALVKRIVFQFSEKLVYSLIEVLEPAEAAFIIAYLEKLKKGHKRRHFVKKDPQHFEKVRLRVTLSYLLDRGDSYFNRKEFVKSTLHDVAQHYNISYREVMNWFIAVLEEENELRDSKSELASIIREIAQAEPAAIETDTNTPEPVPHRPFSFFDRAVFTEGNNIIVLLRNDNETRFFINRYKQDFNEELSEFLENRKRMKIESSKIVLLYEEGLPANDISMESAISTLQLAASFRQYISKGYMSARRVFSKHQQVRHLFTVWLKRYPHQFKLLLRLLVPDMESGNSTMQRTVKLHRALYLFFGGKAARMISITNELLALPAYYAAAVNVSYFRQFVILKAFQFTREAAASTAYRKYLMTAVAREFRLSEDQLELLLKNRGTSNRTMTDERHLPFRSVLNTPFSFKPGTEILQRMAENQRAGKGIDALQVIGLPGEQDKFAQPEWTGSNMLPGYLSDGHLSAIEFYLLFSSLPWWYSHDSSLLREQLHVLVTRKDKQLLALFLKHRTNKTFVDNLVQEWTVSGGERFVPVLIGLQPGILLRLYGELDSFLKGMHVPGENVSFRFFEALLAVIIEAKSFDIRRSDFLARLFRPLINEKSGSRKRVEKLMLRLAAFSLMQGGQTAIDFDKRDSFIKLLTAFFREEHNVRDETMAMMLGEQLGNMILNQYSGKLSEPFNDTIDILCEMKASQPLHSIWIDELSSKLGEAVTISLLVKQLAYSKNARRSAWLLRGLLRKKRASFLQHTRLSNEEMMGSVAVLLMHDHTALSFVRDTETVFTTVTSSSKQTTLFWPVVLDYTLKRSAFNQKNLLYSLLNSFSQAGKVSFYQLVADAISFLQSAAYRGNRQPLLQLLYDMAGDKKIAQVLHKKEAPILPATVKEMPVKNAKVTAKKHPEEKKPFKPMLEEGESVYISNAGLVLINPFIKRLFDMLSYTEKNAFKSGEEKTRAIQLLQFIAAGFENAGEQYLFFNKILCGADPLLPLETTIELSAGEKEAAESLLAGVITNWPAMKNATIDGLRGSYLLRDGRLKTSEDAWKLVVEKKPYDILLNQLPWGFATIKLPWMPKPVFVQWI